MSLPDVHNGYFIHRILELLRGVDRGDATRIVGGPYEGAILPLGSDGGGGLIAFRTETKDVLLLRGGEVAGGTYRSVDLGADRRIAASFESFLVLLLADVAAFVKDTPGHEYIS